jgi:hypothetical protein
MKYNGGEVRDITTPDIKEFLSLDGKDEGILDYIKLLRGKRGRLLVPFAVDQGGNCYCLKWQGGYFNGVSYYKFESESELHIANDFSEFLSSVSEDAWRPSGDPNWWIDVIQKNDVVKLDKIIKDGLSTNVRDSYGRNMLEESAMLNSDKTFMYLFERGVDIGNSAQLAMQNNSKKILKILKNVTNP